MLPHLSIPDDVIEQVHALAQQQKANPGLVFADHDNQSMDDLEDFYYDEEEDDDDYNPKRNSMSTMTVTTIMMQKGWYSPEFGCTQAHLPSTPVI